MSDIHSVDEAYETIAEAMNYLRERGEEPWFDDGMMQAQTAIVLYSNPQHKFYVHNRKRS